MGLQGSLVLVMKDFTFPPMKEEDRFSYPSDRKAPTKSQTLRMSTEGETGVYSLAGCLLSHGMFGPIILLWSSEIEYGEGVQHHLEF